MIALLQRVSEASVSAGEEITGRIGPGLLIFLGVFREDSEEDCKFLSRKISEFRIFDDDDGKMNLSIKESAGSALVVSQFTLCANWRKGRRPSFLDAASPPTGEQLYEQFIRLLSDEGIVVEIGQFGAMMNVKLINNGPVTFVLDSNARS